MAFRLSNVICIRKRLIWFQISVVSNCSILKIPCNLNDICYKSQIVSFLIFSLPLRREDLVIILCIINSSFNFLILVQSKPISYYLILAYTVLFNASLLSCIFFVSVITLNWRLCLCTHMSVLGWWVHHAYAKMYA